MDALHLAPACPAQPAADRFRVGSFLVEPDGGMRMRGDPALRFAWRGRSCGARVSDGRLRLSVAAGAVPYTAERPGDRPAAFAAIGRLSMELPRGWRLRVLPNHSLLLEKDLPLCEPTTAAALVCALVQFALALDPYLDRLELAGVAAGAGGAGDGGLPGRAKT